MYIYIGSHLAYFCLNYVFNGIQIISEAITIDVVITIKYYYICA